MDPIQQGQEIEEYNSFNIHYLFYPDENMQNTYTEINFDNNYTQIQTSNEIDYLTSKFSDMEPLSLIDWNNKNEYVHQYQTLNHLDEYIQPNECQFIQPEKQNMDIEKQENSESQGDNNEKSENNIQLNNNNQNYYQIENKNNKTNKQQKQKQPYSKNIINNFMNKIIPILIKFKLINKKKYISLNAFKNILVDIKTDQKFKKVNEEIQTFFLDVYSFEISKSKKFNEESLDKIPSYMVAFFRFLDVVEQNRKRPGVKDERWSLVQFLDSNESK